MRRPLKARYVGWCAICGQRIEIGDGIKGGLGNYTHDICPRNSEVCAKSHDGRLVRLTSTEHDTVLVEVAQEGETFQLLVELPSLMFRRLALDFGN